MGLYDPEQLATDLKNQEAQQGPTPQLNLSSTGPAETASSQTIPLDQTQSNVPTTPEKPMTTYDYRLGEQRTAEQSNWFLSGIHSLEQYGNLGDWSKSDPNFDPWPQIKGTNYANYPEFFTNVDNPQELHQAMQRVDEQQQYEKFIQRAPSTAFWSSLAWGALDPLMAIPGTAELKFLNLGKTFIGNATRVAAVTAPIIAGEQAFMYGQHPDYTATQSAIGVAASSIASGAIAGLVGKLASRTATNVVDTASSGLEVADAKVVDAKLQPLTKGVADVLSVGEDLPVEKPVTINDEQYRSPIDVIDEHNMEGHVNPLNIIWEDQHPPEQLNSVAQDRAAFYERNGITAAEAAPSSPEVSGEISKEQLDTLMADIINPKEETSKFINFDKNISPEVLDNEMKGVNTLSSESSAPVTDSAYVDSVQHNFVPYNARIHGLPLWFVQGTRSGSVLGSPVDIEGLASPSGVVRSLTSKIGYMNFPLADIKGKQIFNPVSLESRMHEDMVKSLELRDLLASSYREYLGSDNTMIGKITGKIKSKLPGRLSFDDFNQKIMESINNGGKSDIPQAAKMAQHISNLVKSEAGRLQEVGLLPKDNPEVANAAHQSFFSGLWKVNWNVNKILSDRSQLEDAVSRVLARKARAQVYYKDSKGDFRTTESAYDPMSKSVDWYPKAGEEMHHIIVKGGATLEKVKSDATEYVDNILRMGQGNSNIGDIERLAYSRFANKEQPRLLIQSAQDYEDLKPWLNQNVQEVLHTYLRNVSKAVNFKKLLDDSGVSSIQDLEKQHSEEFKFYRDKLSQSDMRPFFKKMAMTRLNNQEKSSKKLLQDLFKIGLGTFTKRGPHDSLFRATNQYNVARLFNNVVLSSLNDLAAVYYKNSIPEVIWNGYIKNMLNMVNGMSGAKKQDFRDALTAVENVIDDLSKFNINPSMSSYTQGTTERAMSKLANASMKLGGMTTWNNTLEKISHTIAESRLLRNIGKIVKKGQFEALSSREQSYMKEAGIPYDMAKRIDAMQSKYGYDKNGTHISNSRMWNDREAASAFNNAIRTEVRKAPLKTNLLTLPRYWQESELKRGMRLGTGFNFAAIGGQFLSAAARHDHRALTGVIMSIMMGMLSKKLQDKVFGRKSNYSLKDWILHGIDKSAITGMLGDPLFQAKYAYDNIKKWGGSAWINEPLDYLVGPSASIINPAYHAIMEKIAGQHIDKKTSYQIKSLIPLSKFYWLPKTSRSKR